MSGEGKVFKVPSRQYRRVITPRGQTFPAGSLPGVTSTPQYIKEEIKETKADDVRKKIGAKMNKETLLCDIDKFLGYYGPRKAIIKAQYILECRRYLIKSGVLVNPDPKTFYWRDFKEEDADTAAEGSTPQKKDSDTKKKAPDARKKAPNTKKDDPDAKKDDSDTTKKLTEDAAFANLAHIMKAIDEFVATKEGKGHPYVYKLVPSKNLDSEIAKATHRMDAALVSADWEPTSKLPVCLVYHLHEYKKENNIDDKVKNRLQTAGDAHWVMSEDPRRTHVFAISAEGRRMSVWYFSRSHSMKTLSFDWIGKDINTCIHVFLSFALATPEELGVDDSVTLAPLNTNAVAGSAAANQHFIYRFPVEPDSTDATDAAQPAAPVTEFKYFKTVQIIKEMRPYNLAGRNTRIWRVVEVKGPNTNEVVTGDEFVLKDVWLEDTRKTEAENLDLIFEDLEKLIDKAKRDWGDNWKKNLFDKDDRFTEFDEATKDELRYLLTDQKYKSLFLTKLHAWKGKPSLEVRPWAMHSRRGEPIFQGDAIVTNSHIKTAARTQGAPGLYSISSRALDDNGAKNRDEEDRPFAPRAPSRFIYKEVCFDLDTVGTLGNVMDVLNQALKALRILFCAGWVHRDISSNNILAFKDSDGKWKAKLADLEFSQRFAQATGHGDHRTGTPYFMPTELMEDTHLLEVVRASKKAEASWTMAGQLNLEEGTAAYDIMKGFSRISNYDSIPADANLDAIPQDDTDVRYNFQHDLEAIWWIIVYFISARVDHAASQLGAAEIFKISLEPSKKRLALFKQTIAERSFFGRRLHEHLREPFLDFIEDLRETMYREYIAREVFGRMQVPHTYSAIHAKFAKEFANLLADNVGKWVNMPILSASAIKQTVNPALPPGRKRGRGSDDGHDIASTSKKAKHYDSDSESD